MQKRYKMRCKNSWLLFSIVVIFSLSACKNDFQPKNIQHVVIIGVDGMSVAGVAESKTPNFDEFMKTGAWSMHTRNVIPTSSSPNWEAMLTGSGVAQTGVTSNNWRYDNFSLPPVVTTENGRYPDIFYAIKRSNPTLATAAVYHWSGFGNLFDHDFVDFDFDCTDEKATTQKVAEVIKNDNSSFLFIQLDHVDHAGHEFGHMTPKYFEAIELADKLAGEIVEATKDAGTYDNTLFLVVADHGGKGFGHGDETVAGNEVPFIMFGCDVKEGYEIPAAVNLVDVAATSAYALNVKRPQVWIGRPVECAFEGAPEPKNLGGSFMAPSTFIPKIFPQKKNGEVGGLFVDENAKVTMETVGKEGKIRFTTDGSIPTAKSQIYTSSLELSKTTVLKAAYFGDDGSQSASSEGYFRVVKNVGKTMGVNYTIYRGNNWAKLPDFSMLKPVEKGRSLEISTDQPGEQIKDYTGIDFEGFIQIDKEGNYTFSTISDDGSKLYIDGNLVVDNDGDHGTQEREGSVNLTSGKHKIRVEYFNGGGGYFLNVFFRGPEITKQIISPDYLTIN
jgi:hypothetical protein